MDQYLQDSYFLDYHEPIVSSFVKEHIDRTMTDVQKAVSLYHAVRDRWKYRANVIYFNEVDWKCSVIMQREEGHCLDKAILLISCLRSVGIPARIHLAKVKNHIAAEHLIEKFGTNELTPHGMLDLYLGDKWIKVSPSFNKSLCERLNVAPLDFNGEHDCVFQQYNSDGDEFMEYIEDYGHFDDLPLDFIYHNFSQHYSGLKDKIKDTGVLSI